MRIKIINPNTTQSFTDALQTLADTVSRPDTEILAVSPASGPASIESFYDEALSVPGVLEEIIKGDREENIDAYVLACFGDPGLYAARELTDKPVLGIAEAAFHMAVMSGAYFTIVTTAPRVRFMTEHLVNRYGFSEQCKNIRTTPMKVLDLATSPETAIAKVIAECLLAIKEDHAEAIVLGCAGMSQYREYIEQQIGIPVIDGTVAAVKLCEAMVDMKLGTSKVLTFSWPRPEMAPQGRQLNIA
ncbi:aspartate/glutamate racemase family protein [Oceanisphaera sp. IT1-181]|uniref:aspartate/glutamate racemase family protein n=1 Tax=Oceanisphaera sp. IT1-181 TaxID=3081199 RepID=UPI0029CA1CDB|nr:aspartate/glutamate racemase family protein [Oceanisphaera sp. IT1-181]